MRRGYPDHPATLGKLRGWKCPKKKASLKGISVAERTRNLGQMDRRHIRGLLDEKDAFLQTWGTRSPMPAAQPWLSPVGGVRDPLPFPAPPWNHKADEELRRLQGSAFCIWVDGGRSILPEATLPVDAEACLKSISSCHHAVTPPGGRGDRRQVGMTRSTAIDKQQEHCMRLFFLLPTDSH